MMDLQNLRELGKGGEEGLGERGNATQLAPVSGLQRYCTEPGVKCDAFIRLERGEDELIRIL